MWKPAALLLTLVMIAGCSDTCGNTIIATKAAPDGRHTAVLFQRDCGATTGFSTHVSVLNADRPISGAGNAFVADDDHGAAQAASWGGPWAELVWISPGRLLVRYDSAARVYRRSKMASGVQVSFKPAVPTYPNARSASRAAK